MIAKTFLAPAALALALAAPPALAQHHGHDTMPSGAMGMHSGATGIAEGTVKDGVRVVDVAVTEDGFVPSRIKVQKDEEVRLVVTRKTDRTCAKEIVIQGFGIQRPLPLGEAVAVSFTPTKSGEIRYACGMGHVSGVVFVP